MPITPKYWIGSPPETCDVSGQPIVDKFIDGKTMMGPWACMTPEAHRVNGMGLGLGKGQEYTKQADGRWLKTEG